MAKLNPKLALAMGASKANVAKVVSKRRGMDTREKARQARLALTGVTGVTGASDGTAAATALSKADDSVYDEEERAIIQMLRDDVAAEEEERRTALERTRLEREKFHEKIELQKKGRKQAYGPRSTAEEAWER